MGKKKASEQQVGGDHYKNCAIQPTEYIIANNLSWCEGNAVKYITRHRIKGEGLQDLLKAQHYINLCIELEYGGEDV
tara:strand:- start:4024 stop:4254 length:231 start_codon:yes stop_codon:yes gene_type:complete